jgi:hypothetical protein
VSLASPLSQPEECVEDGQVGFNDSWLLKKNNVEDIKSSFEQARVSSWK